MIFNTRHDLKRKFLLVFIIIIISKSKLCKKKINVFFILNFRIGQLKIIQFLVI